MTQTPGRPTDGELNAGDIGVGGKLRSTYFSGTDLGKVLDTDDLAGAFVKSAEVMGGSLTLTLQLADGSEMSLPFSPSVAAGTGNAVYVAASTYDAPNAHIQLTIPTPPPDIEIGDIISFEIPDTIDTATDDLQISIVDPAVSGNLFDTDFVEARAIDLTAERFVMILRVARGFVFMNALHLEQIVPIQRATRTITNAELKEIDRTPIELVAAPGAGKGLQILSMKRSFNGSDRPDLTVDHITRVSQFGQLNYCYILSGDSPYDRSNSAEIYSLDSGHFTGGFYAEGHSFSEAYGRQRIIENTAFSVAYTFPFDNDFSTPSDGYSDTQFDLLMATANDNTIEIELQYYVRDF